MHDNWVDFKAVKAAVTMQAVLDRYQINWLRKKKASCRGVVRFTKGRARMLFTSI
jgi:hypothetical protein